MKITIWNEFIHERRDEPVKEIYPEGMHRVIGSIFEEDAKIEVGYATLDQKEHGLSQEVLDKTDVLLWWGHIAHDEVSDEVVERVHQRVLDGMGLIVLHSAHFSKIFKKLMGTSCDLKWREASERERLWVIEPSHPIMEGIPAYFELEEEEMYGEHFDIPTPDEVLMISWFEGGEVFRSANTFRRGNGKIFYFQPGHETHPTYYNEHVRKIIYNAVNWAYNPKPAQREYGNAKALEKIE